MAIINFLFLFLISSFLFPASTNAATFSLSPSTGSYGKDCQSSVDIRLDAQGASTNAADIIIDYDPSKVEIVDADTGTTGVQITTGSVYTSYFGNIVNTSAGIIRLTGASFNSTFTSSGVFGSIQFKPKVDNGTATFTIRFTGANPYNSLDSNIADFYTSNDLLSSVQNGTYTFTSTSCSNDTTSPTITHISPTNGQTGIPATANIVTKIEDSNSGVDQNSVEIIINGVTYKSGQTGVGVSGNASNYTFTVTPTTLLFYNQINTVVVNAKDFAGNSKSSTITFNAPILPTIAPTIGPKPTTGPIPTLSPLCPIISCPTTSVSCPTTTIISPTPTPISTIRDDHKSPSIEFIKPKSKDIIDLSPTLIFKLSDYDSGINLNSLKVTFNQQVYNLNSSDLKYTGDSHSYQITLKINQKLVDSTEYQLEVFIADSNQNGSSQTINLKTKTPVINQIGNIFNNNPLIGQNSAKSTLTQIFRGSLFLLFFSLIPFLLYFLYHLYQRFRRDNNHPYGIVFNSQTHEPINHVKIEIYNQENKLIKKVYSNIFGIFATQLSPGKYRFLFDKKFYRFPSETDFATLDYPHLYHGEITDISPDIYLHVPLDPKITLPNDRFLPKFGITTPHTKLVLKETKFDAIVAIRIADDLGRYRFIVPHGRYQLFHQQQKIGPIIDTRHLIDGYTVINQDIKL